MVNDIIYHIIASKTMAALIIGILPEIIYID